MKITSLIAFILVIIGALNWLLIGVFAFDLVAWICGPMSVLTRIIYALVGVAGLWSIFYLIVYRPFRNITD